MGLIASQLGNVVQSSGLRRRLLDAGVDAEQPSAVVEGYREAQLQALKVGLLLVGFLAVLPLRFTLYLPGRERDDETESPAGEAHQVGAQSA